MRKVNLSPGGQSLSSKWTRNDTDEMINIIKYYIVIVNSLYMFQKIEEKYENNESLKD